MRRGCATRLGCEWTSDGKLRHPAFLGWREDKSPDETQAEVPVDVEREPLRADKPKSSRKRSVKGAKEVHKTVPRSTTVDTSAVVLTNPTKVLYPADGYTKQDVTDYYARVAEPLLHALADRPLALQHWPNGITKAMFFRQSIVATDKAPWMHTVKTPTSTKSGSAEHLVADSPTALAWLAQRATLTVHMWSSREGSLDQPDWVVFDLDPGEGHDIEQAIPVAHALHRLFEQLSLPSVPKTTGKRGLHVLVPLLPGHTHRDAVDFAVQIGTAITSVVPEATLERTISKRNGRLYLDCHQNSYGKTIVAPYSPRALDGATVSAPLKWSEVVPGLAVGAFTIATMPARLDKVGDLFAPALTQGVRLPRFSGNVKGKI
jgi:bifunctional non-homologous end joining protein LigD